LSIPEALRLAPGMQVARVGSSSWAIYSRGALSPFADRMKALRACTPASPNT
jgi:iron complex outermembrane receptor protein